MDIPTRNLRNYVQKMGINLSKMSRETNIPYVSLYDSLQNSARERDLRAGEMLSICAYLHVNPLDFNKDPMEKEVKGSKERKKWNNKRAEVPTG